MTKTYILRVFVIFLNLFLQRGRFIELFYELIKILENRFSESFCFLENFLWVNFLKVTNGRKTCTQFLYTSKMGFLVPHSNPSLLEFQHPSFDFKSFLWISVFFGFQKSSLDFKSLLCMDFKILLCLDFKSFFAWILASFFGFQKSSLHGFQKLYMQQAYLSIFRANY